MLFNLGDEPASLATNVVAAFLAGATRSPALAVRASRQGGARTPELSRGARTASLRSTRDRHRSVILRSFRD